MSNPIFSPLCNLCKLCGEYRHICDYALLRNAHLRNGRGIKICHLQRCIVDILLEICHNNRELFVTHFVTYSSWKR
jgi:hypothetical protein